MYTRRRTAVVQRPVLYAHTPRLMGAKCTVAMPQETKTCRAQPSQITMRLHHNGQVSALYVWTTAHALQVVETMLLNSSGPITRYYINTKYPKKGSIWAKLVCHGEDMFR